MGRGLYLPHPPAMGGALGPPPRPPKPPILFLGPGGGPLGPPPPDEPPALYVDAEFAPLLVRFGLTNVLKNKTMKLRNPQNISCIDPRLHGRESYT